MHAVCLCANFDYLPSFLMNMVTLLGLPVIIPSGNESVSMVRVKVSLSSYISSSSMEILNDTLVTPARNVTLYGPE